MSGESALALLDSQMMGGGIPPITNTSSASAYSVNTMNSPFNVTGQGVSGAGYGSTAMLVMLAGAGLLFYVMGRK